ncbi:MAG: thiamine pyrophosphate-binding protein [Chloroflexi bacterium]|nr:thiamine pyrophosphate-binding protein [Chloroflexota bacterium]
MVKMTGGQALAKSLYREGVRVIFGLPGVQLYHMLDGLYDEPGIRFITVRHEQATGYMADGYARASGEIGTAMMVPGPGLLNASSGISTAYAASSPVLVVCGQIERDEIGGDRGMLHEVNDQLDAIRPVTKWAHRIMDPAEVPEAVHQAFHHLKNGRPRPVEIEIPPETLAEVADVELLEPEAPRPVAANAEQIEAAAEALAGASNPLIWAGGGVISSQGSEALTKLAEYLQAPVVTTAEGKGAISDHHPLALGALWLRNDTIARKESGHDVILAVGTRLVTSQWIDGQQVIQIDVDPEELGRHYENTLKVEGDARLTMEDLLTALSAKTQARADRTAEVAAQKAQRSDDIIKVEPQGELLEAVRRAMPEDGILISGMTQLGYYSRAHYPVYEPRTFITSSYSGNLGYAYPTALGAKVAQPDKAVVCLSGDGGFMFNSQEMSTAVAHGINVVVVVFNDNAFGNVKRDQMNQFKGRVIGADLHNPDFVKLAEAYGVRGLLASGPAELESTLKEALTLDAPVLIEVPVGPMPSPFFRPS